MNILFDKSKFSWRASLLSIFQIKSLSINSLPAIKSCAALPQTLPHGRCML